MLSTYSNKLSQDGSLKKKNPTLNANIQIKPSRFQINNDTESRGVGNKELNQIIS